MKKVTRFKDFVEKENLVDYIDKIIKGTYDVYEVTREMKSILKREELTALINNKKDVCIYEKDKSNLIFLAETIVNGMIDGEFFDNMTFVKDLYNNKYIDPVGDIISNEEIKKCFDIVQEKFKLLDILKSEYPIKILKYEYSHKDFICYGILRNRNESIVLDIIFILFHMRELEKECNPIYVFFFLLGQALNSKLIKGSEIIPYTFIELNKKIGVDLTNANEQHKNIIFSDIFACSAMYNTEFEKYNPFKIFPDEIRKMFEKYYISECKKYLKRKEE